MIDEKAIAQMIEYRRSKQPSPPDVALKEPDPSRVPVYRLWQTPQYLICLVEMEMQALVAAGAAPTRAIQILAETFSLGADLRDHATLTMRLLERHFPNFAHDHGSIVEELASIARRSLHPEAFAWPKREWLSSEIADEHFDGEMRNALERLQIFPRSQFDAQLQHFMIMRRLGGRIHMFSTPQPSWTMLGGRAGYALVDEGRSLAFIETLMN